MKQKLLIASAIFAIFSLASCKKDDPAPGGNNPGTEKKLKKITKTEAGAVTVFNLNYNTAGKLVSYKTADNSEYVLFSYDANGNLTGIEEKEIDFKNIYTYSYQNNVPVSATFKSWNISGGLPGTLIEDDQLAYTVTNNQVSKIKLTMQGAGETNFNLTYTNGLFTRAASEGAFVYTADIFYGNKKPMYPKVTNWVLDQAGFSALFAASNEIVKTVIDFPGTALDQTINMTYTYDANGYVLTSNDGTTQQVFEYQ